MKVQLFDELTRQALDGPCSRHGFAFLEGVYYRSLPSQLCHLLMVDFDTRSRRSFRVHCGLNSPLLVGLVPTNEMGAYVALFLTKGGLSSTQTSWSCADESAALTALAEVAVLFERHAVPWFDAHRTLASFAHELRDEDQDYLKGKLFFEDGNFVAAKRSFEHYLARLDRMAPSNDVEKAREEVTHLLSTMSDHPPE